MHAKEGTKKKKKKNSGTALHTKLSMCVCGGGREGEEPNDAIELL